MSGPRRPVKALVIRADRSWELIQIVPELEPMKQVIGGWMQLVTIRQGSMYLDEDGKMKSLPFNTAARGFARRLGWRGADDDLFVGPALVLGPIDGDGDETPVSRHVLSQWDTFRADHGIPDSQ